VQRCAVRSKQRPHAVESIATSAKEQSLGLAEVNTAVNQMDQVTQQNAAMVEETSAASATLAGESSKLRELIGKLRMGEPSRGTAAVTVNTPHRPVASSARQMASKLAQSFGGNVGRQDSWEDF